MKITRASWQQPLLFFLFYAFIAAGLLAPIASYTFIPNLADYINHLAAISQAKMALAEGQFPLRVAPLEHEGFRYPYYQFFSSSGFTFAALIYRWLTPENPLLAFTITVWCALVAGGIYFYRLADWFVNSRYAAILASVVYLAAPYYIITVNRLGNFNEAIALGLLPISVFYLLKYYFNPTEYKTLLKTTFAWYLLITVHIVTFAYLSFFTAILLLYLTLKNRSQWRNLVSVSIAYVFICLLAMWFLAPIGLFVHALVMGDTVKNSVHFTTFSPSLSYLLSPAATITEGSKSAYITIHPAVGWPILFAVAIACYALFNQLISEKKPTDQWLPALIVMFLIAFIMVWSPINFWNWLPTLLQIGQYSWRILGQVIWIGALLFAWAVNWLFKDKLDIKYTIVGVLLIMSLSNSWFPVNRNFALDLDQFIKKPTLIYNHASYDINFNAHTQFVDAIDRMLLYSLMDQFNLQLKTPYIIPQSLLDIAAKPFISVQGSIPDVFKQHKLQLVAEMNNRIISTFPLKPSVFRWDIPLSQFLHQPKNSKSLFQFKIRRIDNKKEVAPPAPIRVARIELTGFLNPAEKLDVLKVKSTCQQVNIGTLCKIQVPASTKLLELPILYYPKLIKITLNGQPVSYQSVLYQHLLITAITPQPGTLNTVKIQFVGLEWANKISWIAWTLWGLLFIFSVIRFFWSTLYG